ncbi:MAG: 1-acyl-sn-glycerol-3-phosphate acyltransferase [Dorea sp.]|nr:1-acyl-sn-glycerol-3-phosphate acyltransferase [Dorea sp.]
MDEYARHKKLFKYLTPVGRAFLGLCYGMEFEPIELEGPSILICNHVTNLDPIYLACCLKNSHTYFVASEHLSRMGKITEILQYLTSFIPQKKGNSAMATVKACIRHVQAGHSVAIFAEGNTCWDGISDQIVSATGKLVKMARVPLVTFRLEGAYLSAPRWRKGIRRGRIKIHPVKVYSPEEIKKMTFEEVNEAINQDIYENIWDQQAKNPVAYSGKNRADGLERALFLCPECKKIGTLHSHGNVLACQCGFERKLNQYGFFEPAAPFANIHEWDVWQKEELMKLKAEAVLSESAPETITQSESAPEVMTQPEPAPEVMTQQNPQLLFGDDKATLYKIANDHEMENLGTGRIEQFGDKITACGHIFPLEQLEGIAIVNTRRLLFTCDKIYYEVRGGSYTCMRKYFLFNKE